MYSNHLSIDDIRRDLRSFLERIETGERVVITKRGKVLAEVKPLAVPMTTGRPFGLCEGDFTVPDDFDAPLPTEVHSKKITTLKESTGDVL